MTNFKKLRHLRHSLGLSLKIAADLLHISFTTLGQYERGDRAMPKNFEKEYETFLNKCSNGEIQYKKSSFVVAKTKTNSQKLKALRQTLGLTQTEMGEKIGVSQTSIYRYEKGDLQEKENSSINEIIDDFLLHNDFTKKIHALHHSFEPEHCYKITSGNQQSRANSLALNGENNERSYVYRYVGKQGIHHCFREIHGGWSRTFTDPQLIGKKIQEVKE